MIRALRGLIFAVVIATSLLMGASQASADTIPVRSTFDAPAFPTQLFDITWE